MRKLFYILFEDGCLFLLSSMLILGKVLGIFKCSWVMTLLGVFTMYASFVIAYIILAVTDKHYEGFRR